MCCQTCEGIIDDGETFIYNKEGGIFCPKCGVKAIKGVAG